MSLLVLSEVLGLFLNTFFFQFYAAFLNFTSTFEHFEKKKNQRYCIYVSETIDCKRCVYLNVLKAPFENSLGQSTY